MFTEAENTRIGVSEKRDGKIKSRGSSDFNLGTCIFYTFVRIDIFLYQVEKRKRETK